MAGTSLLTLIDDIATLLDDVATMSKVALEKTAGVVGDDLALNAKQIVGVEVDRELPVVWAVGKGSMVNKAILVPVALAISSFAPWAVNPLLMIGGAYLCFEGSEKLLHYFSHRKQKSKLSVAAGSSPPAMTAEQIAAIEKERIQGAIRTDFVLSAEIIVIALGTVAEEPFRRQMAVLCAVAILMTVGVYGAVAAIIKLDDAGLFLSLRSGDSVIRKSERVLGRMLLSAAPRLMKTLSIAGTAAMFMVGGGILTHGIPALHHHIEGLGETLSQISGVGPLLGFFGSGTCNAVFGIVVGAICVGIVGAAKTLRRRLAA